MDVIDVEELGEAVRLAGGPEVAAAALGVSRTTVERWLRRETTIPGTREKPVREFIVNHSAEPTVRPLGSYSSRQLLDEISMRLAGLGALDRTRPQVDNAGHDAVTESIYDVYDPYPEAAAGAAGVIPRRSARKGDDEQDSRI